MKIQGGWSDWFRGKECMTLLPTTVLMALADCQSNKNVIKTYMFSAVSRKSDEKLKSRLLKIQSRSETGGSGKHPLSQSWLSRLVVAAAKNAGQFSSGTRLHPYPQDNCSTLFIKHHTQETTPMFTLKSRLAAGGKLPVCGQLSGSQVIGDSTNRIKGKFTSFALLSFSETQVTRQKMLHTHNSGPPTLADVKYPNFLAQPLPETFSVDGCTEMFFDVETTGLAVHSHITQIAVVSPKESYSCYVQPKEPISLGASLVTDITMDASGQMFHKGKPVKSVSITQCLVDLCSFLRKKKKVLLIGHNIHRFDCPVLMNAAAACNMMDSLATVIYAFMDTLRLFKAVHPGLLSYTQENLIKYFLGNEFLYAKHTALGDSSALQQLIHHCKFDNTQKEAHSFLFCYLSEIHSYTNVKRVNKESLNVLVHNGILSERMADKMAGNGLCFDHLKWAFHYDQRQGITTLFTSCLPDGKIRVTKSNWIIDRVADYFQQLEQSSD